MVSMRFPLVYEVGEDNPKKINVKELLTLACVSDLCLT